MPAMHRRFDELYNGITGFYESRYDRGVELNLDRCILHKGKIVLGDSYVLRDLTEYLEGMLLLEVPYVTINYTATCICVGNDFTYENEALNYPRHNNISPVAEVLNTLITVITLSKSNPKSYLRKCINNTCIDTDFSFSMNYPYTYPSVHGSPLIIPPRELKLSGTVHVMLPKPSFLDRRTRLFK